MPNNQLSQVYQVIIQDLEEVLESNFFKEDTTRVLKDIRDTWVGLRVAYFWRMRTAVAHMTLIGGKLGDCGRSSLEVWGLRLLGPKPLLPNRFELIRTWKKQRIRFYKNVETINKQKTGREVQFQKCVTKYQGGIAKVTNAEVDKWAKESGEPSVRRSPRPMKRVNYAEDNSDEERKMRRVNSQSTESPQPRTPPQAPRVLTPLKTTPNKRPRNKEEIQRYSEDISVICAFDKSVSELTLEIGEELAIELSSIRDINPAVWSDALEKYVDTSLKETGKKFKTAIQVEVLNEPFRLYCEKVLLDFYNLVDVNSTMDRNIGERKFITYQISSILKFYERTFLNLNFDWIESHASSAKITKSATNSGIVKVDSKATRYSDGQEVWHMEVAGGPCKTTDLHTLALIPFSFNGRNQYKALLRMMAIFHDEITKQEELMGEIERSVLRSKGTTVRHVLKIPDELFK
ncbi:16463_t:CDS:2 [Dentiscutata erythropus]|uniref:16463_t:CDS:1 n=1 Tax=Dentiscutata erythropus TaxID=1348616 RepID=A0A9N9G3D3_9GLOM|nr:16463_t:CDS:2 [Dentiscutata erythropus]